MKVRRVRKERTKCQLRPTQQTTFAQDSTRQRIRERGLRLARVFLGLAAGARNPVLTDPRTSS